MFLRILFRAFALSLLVVAIHAQAGIRGQIYLPDGSTPQRPIRFTLMSDHGLRREELFTDSGGRIRLFGTNTPFTITVESDGENYDTTSKSFDVTRDGNFLRFQLNPLKHRASAPPSTVDAGDAQREVSPKARESYLSALALLREGKYQEAVEPLKRAIEIQKDYFIAHADLGVTYMKLNRLDLAEEALRKAIHLNNKVHVPQLNLGLLLNQQGKHKEAIEVLRRIEQRQPDLWEIQAPLIDAQIRLQQWSQAEDQIKKALGCKDADVVDLKIKMGTVQMRLGRFEPAAAVLREAATAQPDNATVQLNLGAALLQLANLAEAEKALLRAYELKGADAAGAQLLLGQLHFQKGDYPKAIQAFEIYLKDMPNAPNAAKVRESIDKLRQSGKKQ